MHLRSVDEFVELQMHDGWVRARCRGVPSHAANAPGGGTTDERLSEATRRLFAENPGCEFCEMGFIRVTEATILG